MPQYALLFYDEMETKDGKQPAEVERAENLSEALAKIVARIRWYRWVKVARLEKSVMVETWVIDLEPAAEVMDFIEQEWESERECRPEPLRN